VTQRKVWIDVAKGLGIISVVFGHILQNHWVFLWHMPLFFVLSGYNFHAHDNWGGYLNKLIKRLLYPYFMVLFICLLLGEVNLSSNWGFHDLLRSLPNLPKLSIENALYGGVKLTGVYAVFWFVTVLFVSLVLFSLLSRVGLRWWMVVCLMIVGYVPQYHRFFLPWNLQVVPMVLAYEGVGCLLRDRIDDYRVKNNWHWLIGGLVFLCIVSSIPALSQDMKYNVFGIFLISFVFSVLCVFSLFVLSKHLSNTRLAFLLSLFGKGSLFVMYSHMFINTIMAVYIPNNWIRLFLVLFVTGCVLFFVDFISDRFSSGLIRDRLH